MSQAPKDSRWIWTSVKALLAGLIAFLVWKFLVQPRIRTYAVERVATTVPDGLVQIQVDQLAFEIRYMKEIEDVEKEMATARHDAVVDDFRQRFRLPPPVAD